MTPAFSSPSAFLYAGDCVEVLKGCPDNFVDAVVCDPPYGLKFMGKGWDSMGDGAAQQKWHEAWVAEAFRVLKPGGYLLAFGGSRTFHRLACAVEDAGFEIRDSLMWLYGVGFPKSMNVGKALDALLLHGRSNSVALSKSESSRPVVGSVKRVVSAGRNASQSGEHGVKANMERWHNHTAAEIPVTAALTDEAKQWDGWGTALKPSHEPAVLARKPLEGTVARNVLKWGTGALNIDGCHTGDSPRRWPANVMLDEEAGAMLGAPSRFFYCAKTSTAERNAGCENLPDRTAEETVERDPDAPGARSPRAGAGRGAGATVMMCAKCGKNIDGGRAAQPCKSGGEHEPVPGEARPATKNHHPTVKPVALMRWLVRLVTPPGGLVLDPFTGSGSTGVACVQEGVRFVGIEREAEYVTIAAARLAHAIAGAKSEKAA